MMPKPIIDNLTLPIGCCSLERTESGAQVILENGKAFSITFPESLILQKLVENEGEVITKQELIVAAWGRPEIIGANSLPVAITNLRKILELSNIKITNLPRKGYKIDIPVCVEKELSDSLEAEHLSIPQLLNQTAEQGVLKQAIETLKFYASFVLLAFSSYAVVYIAFSWVKIDCYELGEVSVCSIKGESPSKSLLEGKKGQFYYSKQSGLVEVRHDVG